MLPETHQLLTRAHAGAVGRGSDSLGLDHLVETIAASPAGLEVLSRLLQVRRLAALKEEAIAAQDYETASARRTEERAARTALEEALSDWRGELAPGAEGTSNPAR